MKSAMPSDAYISKEWFLREQKLLFQPLWQFISPRMLLTQPNSFVRRNIAGVDVIVQNIDGQIRAFENVCLHRQSPIQSSPQGTRAMVCPYHAWKFGVDGEVVNIPGHDECYRFSATEKEQLKLKKFEIFEFGQLLFINLSPKPLNFWSQFDDHALESLKEASNLFDDEVLVTCFKGNFNWKLAYENLRDSLHPQFLHARTVYQQVKFKARINEDELKWARDYQITGSLDWESHIATLRGFSGGGLNEPIFNLPKYHWHNNVNRYGNDDWYLNWLMYPNLHIASGSAGYSFIIEHHNPISFDETDLWVYYVTGKKKRKYPTSSAVLMAHLEGAEKVLAEDIAILEKIQRTITKNTPKATAGDFEYTNMMIEKWYLEVMEERYAF